MTTQLDKQPSDAWVQQEIEKDAIYLADAILKASGSKLSNYCLTETREAILNAAKDGLAKARGQK